MAICNFIQGTDGAKLKVSVCVSVCVSMFYRPEFFMDLNDTMHKNSIGNHFAHGYSYGAEKVIPSFLQFWYPELKERKHECFYTE